MSGIWCRTLSRIRGYESFVSYEDMPDNDGQLYFQIDHQPVHSLYHQLRSNGHSNKFASTAATALNSKEISRIVNWNPITYQSLTARDHCNDCAKPIYSIVAEELVCDESVDANVGSPVINFDNEILTSDEIIA